MLCHSKEGTESISLTLSGIRKVSSHYCRHRLWTDRAFIIFTKYALYLCMHIFRIIKKCTDLFSNGNDLSFRLHYWTISEQRIFFADVTEVSFHRFVRKGGYRLMELSWSSISGAAKNKIPPVSLLHNQ